MSRQIPVDLYISNLADELHEGMLGYMPGEEAHAELVKLTGEDFGFDVVKWKEWKRTQWKPLDASELKSPDEILKLMRGLRRS